MKYLIMVYTNPYMRDAWENMSESEHLVGAQAHLVVKQELEASGELLASSALQDASTGKGVQVRDGSPLVTDGPFAEAKEHLAGFYLVDCASEERAIEVAARLPEASFGLAEVRPIRDLSAYGL